MQGYLHSSFANGAGYIPMKDVSDDWDVINLSFGEPDSPTTGNIIYHMWYVLGFSRAPRCCVLTELEQPRDGVRERRV